MKSMALNSVRWFDSRAVTVLTTYEAIQPYTKCNGGQEIQVDCPSAVVTYNQNPIVISVESKKWYHRLIWHFLDIAVVQGCILQKRDTGNANLNLKAFKISVAMSLMKQGKSTRVKRGPPSLSMEKAYESKKAKGPTTPIPNVSIRTDYYAHFSVYSDKQGPCRKPDCQSYTFIQCPKCDVRLCFTRSSNCFKEFHDL